MVVIRPSEYAPLGFGDGVVNLINGDPESMGQEMLNNPLCAKIHFTGSQRVGKLLMDGASQTFTRVSLELGGNAPVLIFADVDLEQVAATAVTAKVRNAGPVCVSPQRFIVHCQIAEEFSQRVTAHVASLRLGNGLNPDPDVGPLINARQRDRVEQMTTDASAAGANLLIAGKRPPEKNRGYFFEPTVVTGVTPGMDIFASEIFGPVLPVTSFQETSEVVAGE